jgi:hypothetical protein
VRQAGVRRTAAVDLLFAQMLPSALLPQGTVLVPLSGTGY